MHTPLEKYFTLRVKNLFNHLHDFELNGDEVSLHDLRVEMKKLRAIIKFLRNIYPDQKLKKPTHLLRNIFQEAGYIRELQIILQWLQKNEYNVIAKIYYPQEKLKAMIEDFQKSTHRLKEDCKEITETVFYMIEESTEYSFVLVPTKDTAEVKVEAPQPTPEVTTEEPKVAKKPRTKKK